MPSATITEMHKSQGIQSQVTQNALPDTQADSYNALTPQLDKLFNPNAAERTEAPRKSAPCATLDTACDGKDTVEQVPGSATGAKPAADRTIAQIPISSIVPNPGQPRKFFSESSIIKLADSIRQFGIIQPLTVRKSGHLYELIAGERRLRAAKELCWSTVPCIISEVTEEKSAQISIIENLLREDLNIFEQAIAIQALIDTYSLTQEQIAEKLSSSQSYIANKLRLLRFSQEERNKLLQNNLSERHARALLRINDHSTRAKAIDTIINDNLNVTQAEELVQSLLYNNEENRKMRSRETKAYKDIPSFYNAVNRAIDCAKIGNLDIKCRKIVGESFTELTIIIPTIKQDNE